MKICDRCKKELVNTKEMEQQACFFPIVKVNIKKIYALCDIREYDLCKECQFEIYKFAIEGGKNE